MSHDAWKDTGDCAECRRARYCNKQCTASKARLDRIFTAGFSGAVATAMSHHVPSKETSEKDHHDRIDATVYSIDALRKLADE